MKQKTEELLLAYGSVLPPSCRESVGAAAELLCRAFRAGGKLMTCGNGGSAAQAEHMVAELMKPFACGRPLADAESGLFAALPAISLTSQTALIMAIANDCGYENVFAQQVVGYGKSGDVLLAVSTSGKSPNVLRCAELCRRKGIRVIALTGSADNDLAARADLVISVPETETWRIQDVHSAVCHLLCLLTEAELFCE